MYVFINVVNSYLKEIKTSEQFPNKFTLYCYSYQTTYEQSINTIDTKQVKTC